MEKYDQEDGWVTVKLVMSKINLVISIFDLNLNISQSEVTPQAPTNITTLHGQFECWHLYEAG